MSSTPNTHVKGGNGSGVHGHSSVSKYQHEDSDTFPGLSGKIPSSSSLSEYHAHYDIGQDSRLPKVPRIESHDLDRRSPLLPPYRVSLSSNDLHPDHPADFESRLEFRDFKYSNRDSKFENRDNKIERGTFTEGVKLTRIQNLRPEAMMVKKPNMKRIVTQNIEAI